MPVPRPSVRRPDRDAEHTWTVEEGGENAIRATSATPGESGVFALLVRSTR